MSLALLYSEDENVIVVLSVAVWVATWFLWYRGLRAGSRLRKERVPVRWLGVMPFVALALLLVILMRWASSDVRTSPSYLFQYVALGAAWLGAAIRISTWFGISARDDVAERGNPAAAVALSGALLGLVLCYAGGNVGDGPGWWVVVFSSGLATACFLVSWAVFESGSHASDAITIDRDLAAATRHAAFSVTQGLVLGRAVAGDWRSGADTFHDLAVNGWPALLVLALAILLERSLRPTGDAPRRSPLACGLVPGALLLAGALGWIAWLGEAA